MSASPPTSIPRQYPVRTTPTLKKPIRDAVYGIDRGSSDDERNERYPILRPGRDLAKIIESDPILTARMLGLANSVAFGGSAKPIFKVSEAIVRLGVDTVLTAAFSQLSAQWLRGACKHFDPLLIHGLWLEYLISAHCAREIAKRLPDGEVDGSLAYAAGLLHDVGTIALLWLI